MLDTIVQFCSLHRLTRTAIHTSLHNLVGEIVDLKHRVEFHHQVSETLSFETGGSPAVSSKPFVNLFAWFPLCNVFHFHKMYSVHNIREKLSKWFFLAQSICHIDHLLPPWKFHTQRATQHISFDFTWLCEICFHQRLISLSPTTAENAAPYTYSI